MTATEQDIEARCEAAGLVVPADLLRMAALLRGPRTAAAEPFSTRWPESGQ